MVMARAATLVREERAQESAQYLAREPGIPGTAIPERVRQRQHPLAYRDFRNDVIDETGGGIGHSAPTTRGAEPSAFARKSQQPVVAAGIAVQSEKASSEDSAVEVGAQFALDEVGDRRALFARIGKEGLEILSDNLVEQRLLRLVALVLCHAGPVRDRVEVISSSKGMVEPITIDRWPFPYSALRTE